METLAFEFWQFENQIPLHVFFISPMPRIDVYVEKEKRKKVENVRQKYPKLE